MGFPQSGRGGVNFEEIIRALNDIGYEGPLSIEWEDMGWSEPLVRERLVSSPNVSTFPQAIAHSMPRLTKVIKDLLACGNRLRFARFELVVVR